MWSSIFFVLLSIVAFAESFSFRAFPSYIHRCSRSDPQIDACIVNNANRAIRVLVQGDSAYRIPNMLPLRLPKIVINNDNNLNFIIQNLKIYGLEGSVMENARMNFENKQLSYNIYIPKITILGDFEMTGHLVKEAVNGAGEANITILNGRYSNVLKYSQLDGKLLSSNMDYNPGRVIYNFNHLYRGNEFIGYQRNVFFNNNWKEVSQTFHRGAASAMNDIVFDVYKKLYISLNDMFTS